MPKDVIRLERVFKNYYLGKTEVPVLKGIDLNISQNEYVALMGPSGSGKSTLMNILGCLDTVSKGNYFLNAPIIEMSSCKQAGKATDRMSHNGLALILFGSSCNGFSISVYIKIGRRSHAMTGCIYGYKFKMILTQMTHQLAPPPGVGFPAMCQ